jgi:hypothetical protein
MLVNYELISSFIPEFINSLYNKEALASTDLSEIRDAFRKKQIICKVKLLDLVDQFSKKESQILVIGSWIGFTSFCLNKMGYSYITEVDLDSRLEPLTTWANRFNKNFKHITSDVNNIDLCDFDVIINTSCEHMDNQWFYNVPNGTLIFAQSTDYVADDHTNLCSSLDDMISKYPMNLISQSTIDLEYYKRYMLAGYR